MDSIEPAPRPERTDGAVSVIVLGGVMLGTGFALCRAITLYVADSPHVWQWITICAFLTALAPVAYRSWRTKQHMHTRISTLENEILGRDQYRDGYAKGYLDAVESSRGPAAPGPPVLRSVN